LICSLLFMIHQLPVTCFQELFFSSTLFHSHLQAFCWITEL
jgi:hypothetical protein